MFMVTIMSWHSILLVPSLRFAARVPSLRFAARVPSLRFAARVPSLRFAARLSGGWKMVAKADGDAGDPLRNTKGSDARPEYRSTAEGRQTPICRPATTPAAQ